MNKIYFVRHAKPDNPERIVGHNSDISIEGKAQLEQLTKYFLGKSAEIVFHSPQLRAKETAVAVANHKPDLLQADVRLRERQWGKDDATWNDISETLSRMSLVERYEYKPPKGESWQEFEARIAEFWDEKVKDLNQDMSIVSHEGTMRCVLAYLLRERLGGLNESLAWSIQQNFAFGSVSIFDKDRHELQKEVFVPKLDTE